jgi:methyl-accepting chemotaxis protein
MKWRFNLGFGAKLLLAPISVLVLLLLVAAVGLYGLKSQRDALQELYEVRLTHFQLAGALARGAQQSYGGAYQILTWANLNFPKEKIDQLIQENSKTIGTAAANLDALVSAQSDEAGRTLGESARAELGAYRKSLKDVMELAQDDTATAATYMDKADKQYAQLSASIAKLEKLEEAKSAAAYAGAQANSILVLEVQGLIVLLSVAASIMLTMLVKRAILTQIGGDPVLVMEVAQRVSAGDLSSDIELKRGDQSSILHAMQEMMQRLRRFEAAQRELAHRHKEGGISHRIATSDLPGSFGSMAAQINEIVAQHIGVSSRVVAVVQGYAHGDFSDELEELPGEYAATTAALGGVKQSFQAINAEVLRLAESAARGDFTTRGDASAFQNDFARLVVALNGLMEISDRGLADLSRVLTAIADGNLAVRIDSGLEGTFAQVEDDARRTIEQLRTVVTSIRQGTESINTAAREMAQGNHDLSARTEQQAANLEETASSMEQLMAAVRQNAQSANEANQLTSNAAKVAQKGGAVVGDVVETMDSISQSARKIAEIIGVIDGIAFQTNILALNAAVEAARAGEQGRGFAVVATEVRALAQRSSAAAREIKDLIEDSVSKVNAGSTQVNLAGATMREIMASVQSVKDIMAAIAAASTEQSAGIAQVTQAVGQMDETTQQNAALVEEAAAAAGSVEQQARQLVESVAVFRLPADGAELDDGVVDVLLEAPRRLTAPRRLVAAR